MTLFNCFILLYFFSVRLFLDFAWSFVFSSLPQQPMTSDFEGFLYQILSITLFACRNSWERASDRFIKKMYNYYDSILLHLLIKVVFVYIYYTYCEYEQCTCLQMKFYCSFCSLMIYIKTVWPYAQYHKHLLNR